MKRFSWKNVDFEVTHGIDVASGLKSSSNSKIVAKWGISTFYYILNIFA